MSINYDGTNQNLIVNGNARWEVVVSSKVDLGLGSTGAPDYPYFAFKQWGGGSATIGTSQLPGTSSNPLSGQYLAELAEEGLGITDAVAFTKTSAPPSTHLECVGGICQRVAGIGLDKCTTAGDYCTGLSQRKELVTNLTSNESLIKAAVFFSSSPGVSQQYVGKRQEGNNWVFSFDLYHYDSTTYAEMGAGAGLANFIAKNWSSIAALLVSLGVVAIVWLWRDAVTAQPERDVKISDNDTKNIAEVLDDPSLTADQKQKLIEEILKKSYGGTDWQTTIIIIVIIIAVAYIVSSMMKRRK